MLPGRNEDEEIIVWKQPTPNSIFTNRPLWNSLADEGDDLALEEIIGKVEEDREKLMQIGVTLKIEVEDGLVVSFLAESARPTVMVVMMSSYKEKYWV